MTVRILAYADSRIFSGAESIFCSICANLARRGIAVQAVVARENDELRVRLESAAIACRPIAGQELRLAAFFLYRPSRLYRVRRLLRDTPPDAVLVNLPSAEYGSAPALVAPAGVPLAGILHIHGSPARLGFALGGLRSAAARPALRGFDRLFCIAPGAAAETALEWGIDAQAIEPLPTSRSPPPIAFDRLMARRAVGVSADDEVVLLLGRVSARQKGHDVLLRAATLLLRHRPRLRLLIVGDGPDERPLRQLAGDLGIAERVTIAAGQDGPWAAFAAADAIALPSRFEGLPLVALEALEAGLGGVASSVDGLRFVWPEQWQVAPDDPPALAARLATVLDCPARERARIVAAARERARAYTSDAPEQPVFDWLLGVESGHTLRATRNARLLRGPGSSASTGA